MGEILQKLLAKRPKPINVGLEQFSKSLREQGVQVVQVDWKPEAGGDPEMIELLSKLL